MSNRLKLYVYFCLFSSDLFPIKIEQQLLSPTDHPCELFDTHSWRIWKSLELSHFEKRKSLRAPLQDF